MVEVAQRPSRTALASRVTLAWSSLRCDQASRVAALNKLIAAPLARLSPATKAQARVLARKSRPFRRDKTREGLLSVCFC